MAKKLFYSFTPVSHSFPVHVIRTQYFKSFRIVHSFSPQRLKFTIFLFSESPKYFHSQNIQENFG